MAIPSVRMSDGVLLAVRECGSADGPAVLQLSGGPGCVNYLPDPPAGATVRVVSPDPRGVGGSGGGPHGLGRALSDLEDLRRALGVDRWVLVGHSGGADLALAYAVEHPTSVVRVVAACGTGVQDDRSWHATYDALRDSEPPLEVAWEPAVHRALLDGWREWIKHPDLLRRLAGVPIPIHVVLAERDIRPGRPLEQVAALVPRGSLRVLPGAPHDFWHTDPQAWHALVAWAAGGAQSSPDWRAR